MEKIEMGTPDGAVENIEKIAELFPQVMTEVENADGELERAVDFDALRDLLGDVAEGQRERYQFTWPGKREAKAEARRPIYKTMIPEPGKSKDWDTTENLYIEGDNLDALKILKETYAGKVSTRPTTRVMISFTMMILNFRTRSTTPYLAIMTNTEIVLFRTPPRMEDFIRGGVQ